MLLLEQLPQNDKDMICQYINTFAGEQGCHPDVEQNTDMDYILRHWAEAKERLYHLFGDQFIIGLPVEFNKARSELCNDCRTLIRNNSKYIALRDQMFALFSKWDHWFCGCESEDEMRAYLPNEKWIELGGDYDFIHRRWAAAWAIRSLFEEFTLADNEYIEATTEVPLPDGKTYKVQRGCKPMRAIAKIAEAYGIEGVEDFRIAHSQVLNKKKIKGTLHLSIHPLDYLTMSDNASGWESCMNWYDAGQYRAGTVEMMNSPSVVVAYLCNDECPFNPCHNVTWNNKKWRQLFVIDPDFMLSIKAYPYEHPELTQTAMQEFFKVAGWDTVIHEFKPHNVNNLEDADVSIKMTTQSMYNDFGTTTHFIAMHPSWRGKTYSVSEYCYSGFSECVWCGEYNTHCEEDEALVCCHDCFPVAHCSDCGTLCHADEIYDGCYCVDCYDSMNQPEEEWDALTEEWFCADYSSNCRLSIEALGKNAVDDFQNRLSMRSVIIDTDNPLSKEDWFTLWNRLVKNPDISNIRQTSAGYYYFNVEDLTSEGLDRFGLYDEDHVAAYIQELKNLLEPDTN